MGREPEPKYHSNRVGKFCANAGLNKAVGGCSQLGLSKMWESAGLCFAVHRNQPTECQRQSH